MQQTSGVMMPKISYASTMIVEDHLKKLLASTSNKPFKASNNKLLPRAQHSPFGDFPNEFLPKKQTTVTDFKPIDKHEQSIAAKGVRKFNKYLYHVQLYLRRAMDSVVKLHLSISLRKSLHLKSQELVHLTREPFHLLSSEDSTIEEIFPLLLSMDLKTRSTGKLKSNSQITIITYQYSSRVSEKSKTHTDSSLFKVSSICQRKVVLRFYLSFLN